MKNRKSFKSFVILSLTVVLGSTFVLGFDANHPIAITQADVDKAQAEATLRQMWKAVGTADYPVMKGTLNFPCTLMEITPKGAGTVFSFDNVAAFDKEVVNVPQPKEPSFAGAVISDVKVDLVNAGVANVTYKFFLPERKAGEQIRKQETLNMVAVLRKTGGKWKVAFTSIPM